MITIINRGPDSSEDANNPMGWRKYEIMINKESICFFEHKRAYGLAECLFAAAKAVEKKKQIDAIERMLKLSKLSEIKWGG